MTDARIPRLSASDAKAAASNAGVPDYMAELSIFQVLLHHPDLARAVNDLLATCCGTAPSTRACVIW